MELFINEQTTKSRMAHNSPITRPANTTNVMYAIVGIYKSGAFKS